jgi:hypothetical protein
VGLFLKKRPHHQGTDRVPAWHSQTPADKATGKRGPLA